jgi:predicted nucleic acid-binding protein
VKVLRSSDDLADYLKATKRFPGCFADSGFLYALAYEDDQHFGRANDVLDILSDSQVSIYANVISRMEFIDLIFRKQVTLGCLQLLSTLDRDSFATPLFRVLRNIRDQNTAVRRQGQSFKIGERQLKDVKQMVDDYGVDTDWTNFCAKYVGSMLKTEWRMLEDDFDLRFIEVLEGQTTELFEKPLSWSDMVDVMARSGIRGSDAMIVNMFYSSKLPLLITTDSDIEKTIKAGSTDQAVFLF